MTLTKYLRKYGCGLIAAGFCVLLSSWGCGAQRVSVIKNGAYVNALPVENSWTSAHGAVSGHGLYHLLYAYQYVHDADFEMKATISLERIDSTTALFLLFNNHFGFDSKSDENDTAGNFFFYSPGRKKYVRFGKAREHITPGQPFTFEVTRKDTLFEITVNKTTVASIPLSWLTPPYEGYLAFRPWLNTIHVYDWTLTGDLSGFTQPDFVFQVGEAGYVCFRLPAILKTEDNVLLAFAEGRKRDCWSDGGDTDIVMKRSSDGGRTWGDLKVIWDDGANACHNPTPILDQVNERVVLLTSWSSETDHLKKHRTGKNENIRRAFTFYADLKGENWSMAREITHNAMADTSWWFSVGPGSGIQLKYGAHQGRLVAGAWYVEKATNDYYSLAVYSDDFGDTWQVGNPVPLEGGNESEIVEFTSGELMINSRNYSLLDLEEKRAPGEVSYRITALSQNGGMTWTHARRDSALIEPVCQASLHYVEDYSDHGGVLLFSNPPHARLREDLSVRASLDEGKSWPYILRIYEGPSAYSDLTDLDDGIFGCLFEGGNVWGYEGIIFQRHQLRKVLQSNK